MTYLVKGLPIDSATGKMGQVAATSLVGMNGKTYDAASGEVCVSSNVPLVAQSGFTFDAAGALCIFGASAGLPSPTFYQNGLPFDVNGALCTDGVNAIAYTCGGIPFTTTGAVAAS